VLERESVFGERILPLVTEPLYAMGDIDTELDFQIAEFLFRTYPDQFAPRFDAEEPECTRSL
jgi:CMP-N-acetylneuraminic acid synthetase